MKEAEKEIVTYEERQTKLKLLLWEFAEALKNTEEEADKTGGKTKFLKEHLKNCGDMIIEDMINKNHVFGSEYAAAFTMTVNRAAWDWSERGILSKKARDLSKMYSDQFYKFRNRIYGMHDRKKIDDEWFDRYFNYID